MHVYACVLPHAVWLTATARRRLNKLGTFSLSQLGQSKSPFAEFMRSQRKSNDNFEESLLKLVRTLPTVLKYLPSEKAQVWPYRRPPSLLSACCFGHVAAAWWHASACQATLTVLGHHAHASSSAATKSTPLHRAGRARLCAEPAVLAGRQCSQPGGPAAEHGAALCAGAEGHGLRRGGAAAVPRRWHLAPARAQCGPSSGHELDCLSYCVLY